MPSMRLWGSLSRTARYMKRQCGIPYVEGLPIGREQTEALLHMIRRTLQDGECRSVEEHRWQVDRILVIGEEIFARSLANAINLLPEEQRSGRTAYALWPDVDEGLAEDLLIEAVCSAHTVIADPLYRVICRAGRASGSGTAAGFIDFPHEAYSGRIYRSSIPVFCGEGFDIAQLLQKGQGA